MFPRIKIWASNFCIIALLCGPCLLRAQPANTANVKMELVSQVQQVKPGTLFWVGLRMVMAKHWHVYWRNPGDAGLPPSIHWKLPEGFSAGKISWPHPKKIETAGIFSYGYEGEVVLLIPITIDKSVAPNSTAELLARVDFLACKDFCVPGEEFVATTVVVDEEVTSMFPKRQQLFERARLQLPTSNEKVQIKAFARDKRIIMEIVVSREMDGNIRDLCFFPYEEGVVDDSQSQKLEIISNGYRLEIPCELKRDKFPEKLTGILVSFHKWMDSNSKSLLVNVLLEE